MAVLARITAALILGLALASPSWAQPAQSGKPPAAAPAANQNAKPAAPTASNQNTKAAAAPLVDVNSASAKDLIAALPGIGDARAEAIVKNRPYIEKQDLVKKASIPQSVFDDIKDKVALVDINKATPDQMKAILTGIGDVRSQDIAKHRPYKTRDDLVKKGVLTQGVYDGLKDQIVAGK
ncbi:ComEA family DNA-binding protein [Azospirillum sp.]|uniref:ComEA family DNA-binding protein n=1 Tax=Azospirillum sp. TaxID=34012 RepID=UPI003D7311BC